MHQVLCRQVFLVLAYSAQFSHPLKIAEIRNRLFVPQTNRQALGEFWWQKKLGQLKLIDQALKQLLVWGWVVNQGEWWTLATRRFDLVPGVVSRQLANAKLIWARQVALIFGWWPWIRDIYISGSVAAGASRADDDLDFLIVTWPGCLWLTRPLVIFLAWIFGHRRSWSKEEPNSWCFNIWLESSSLVFPETTRSLYTAWELIQLKQIWGQHHSDLIWSKNAWVYNRLPLFNHRLINRQSAFKLSETSVLGLLIGQIKMLMAILGYPLVVVINYLAYLAQLLYMRPHQTREKVGLNFAFFHPRDTRRLIYANWRLEVIKCLE
ncbi:MAG: hypothetical protein ABIJ03_03690 [Patescibacteria group bacterium]